MQNLGHPVRKDVQHMSNLLCGICIAGQLGIQAMVLIFLPFNYMALRKSLCTCGLLKCVRIVPVNFWLPEIHNFFNFSLDILMADCTGSFSSWEFSVCFWIFYLLAMPAQPLRKRHQEFKTHFRNCQNCLTDRICLKLIHPVHEFLSKWKALEFFLPFSSPSLVEHLETQLLGIPCLSFPVRLANYMLFTSCCQAQFKSCFTLWYFKTQTFLWLLAYLLIISSAKAIFSSLLQKAKIFLLPNCINPHIDAIKRPVG